LLYLLKSFKINAAYPSGFLDFQTNFQKNQSGGEYFYAKFVLITNKREEK